MNKALRKSANNPKLFISYAWKDKKKVRRLATELRSAGIEIWLDESDTRPGDQISTEVSRALKWSDMLILVWSAAACASQWVEQEWGAANSSHKKIVPCLLDETRLPALLADRVYVDFRDFDQGMVSLRRILDIPLEKIQTTESDQWLQNSEKGGVTTKIGTMEIELKIDRNFDEYSDTEKQHLLRAISELLAIDSEIKIKKLRRGSVYLSIELPADKAERLLWLVKSERLVQYGVVNAELKESELVNPLDNILLDVGLLKTQFHSILRSRPVFKLSEHDVREMLQQKGFFDRAWNRFEEGIKHQYELIMRKEVKLVIDHITALTWQQSGSSKFLTYADAEKYIRNLNKKNFAGYNNWRLPTLEEAMSLVEPNIAGGLYIDSIFDRRQGWIWTADKDSSTSAWVVFFGSGFCLHIDFRFLNYVRAVRSRQ